MTNKDSQTKRPLENIIGDLRDDFKDQSSTVKQPDAPKVAKKVRLSTGKSKNTWLLVLTILVVLSGTLMAALLLRLGQRQPTVNEATTENVIEGVTLEDWENYIDPTLPPATAVPLPAVTTEPVPHEPTAAPPDATPWPTPPITPPEP